MVWNGSGTHLCGKSDEVGGAPGWVSSTISSVMGGRALRKHPMGTEGSIYDDLRDIRSSGGFGACSEDNVKGTITLLRSLGFGDSMPQAVSVLYDSLIAVCTELQASSTNYGLASDSLYGLMMVARAPDAKMELMRRQVARKIPTTAEVVRKYEDKLLRSTAKNVYEWINAHPRLRESAAEGDRKADLPPRNPRIVGYDDFERLAELARTMMRSFHDRELNFVEFYEENVEMLPIDPLRSLGMDEALFTVACIFCELDRLQSEQARALCFESDALFCAYYECDGLQQELRREFTTIGISYLKSLVSEESDGGFYGFWTALSRNEIGREVVKRFRVSWMTDCTPDCTHVNTPVYWRPNLCRWHEIEAHCYEFQHALLVAAGVDQESQKKAREKWRLNRNPWGVYGLSNGIFAKMIVR
jgi:hypothetical protein